jgi:hypothetical protein
VPVTSGAPQPSPWCARGDRALPALGGLRIRGLWRFRPRHEVILCNDSCHSRRNCPLADPRRAAWDEWDARCVCPGADASRRTSQRIEEGRRRVAAIFAEVDLSDHPDAENIERRLRGAYGAHGEPVPSLLPALLRLVSAGTGPRRTRSVRVSRRVSSSGP